MSTGTSAIRVRSTSARYPVISADSPELRPNISTTRNRSWLPAGVRSRLMKSTERLTQVEKPMQ